MRAGTLRHQVTLQTVTETRDADGGVVETWADTATLWAAVEPLRGREYFSAKALQAEVTTRIRLRYRAAVVPKQRVTWVDGSTTHTYDVLEVIEPDTRRRELALMCKELI